ncbi:MAG TPA: hypothetical protein PLX67_03250 [bacterium]|nr:hypothetical protein [bacterium]HPW44701.1 hypothetical protein [bacterium]
MKKISFFTGLLVPLVLAGCSFGSAVNQSGINEPVEQENRESSIDLDHPSVSTIQTDTGQTAAVGQVEKFYPDSSAIANPPIHKEATRNFVVTEELMVKIYLVDKYEPGICYGTPSPVEPEAIRGIIDRNFELAEFLKNKYSLPTELAIYEKIKQLGAIQLADLAGGKYKFNFLDGQCCFLKAYEGEVMIIGQNIVEEALQTATQQNPC